MSHDGSDFGARLRVVRKRARMKRVILARRAKISEDYLDRLERGLRMPSWGVACRLAKALDVSLCELGGTRHRERKTLPVCPGEIEILVLPPGNLLGQIGPSGELVEADRVGIGQPFEGDEAGVGPGPVLQPAEETPG